MSFANFTREISDKIHQMKSHLEMTKFEIAFENFSPLRNFNLGRPPTRIRPQKKISLYFSTTFSRPSKVVCFLTLPPFERSFEPSPLSSAPLSPYFSFSCYLGRSPITMKPFLFYLGRSPITIRPFLYFFFHLGRSSITMRPLL